MDGLWVGMDLLAGKVEKELEFELTVGPSRTE
jgi:hypothetical protein